MSAAFVAITDEGEVLFRQDLDLATACDRVIESNAAGVGVVPGSAVAVAQARFILRAHHDHHLLHAYATHVKDCIKRNELPRPLPKWLDERRETVMLEFNPHPLDEIRRAFPGG